MAVKTDPYTFVNGTVADALEVNARFDELYTLQSAGIDSANMDLTDDFAWTGSHTFTSTATTSTPYSITANALTTGSAFNITSNSADTSTRSIASIIQDHASASGATTLTLRNDYSGGAALATTGGNISLQSGADLLVYSDAGSTLKFAIDGATGSFGIPAAQKFFLDGTALSGDTYLQENSANQINVFTGGSSRLAISSTFVEAQGVPFCVQSGNKLNLDTTTGDTYIIESSANVLDFYAGGTNTLRLTTSGATVTGAATVSGNINVSTGNDLLLDGAGGDSYITNEISITDVMRFYSGGTETLNLQAGSVRFPNHGTTASAANAFINSSTGEISRSTSSIRYKENVRDLEFPTENLLKLKAVSYEDKKTKQTHFGLIAEEVFKEIPELVELNKEGTPESVKYPLLGVLLIEEVKKLKAEIEQLKRS